MEDQTLEFVEIETVKGIHKLYLRQTGDLLGTFIRLIDARRAALAIEKAVRTLSLHNTDRRFTGTRYL